MAKEILAINEEDLNDFIRIVRAGIYHIQHTEQAPLSKKLITGLEKWCEEEEEYLNNNS